MKTANTHLIGGEPSLICTRVCASWIFLCASDCLRSFFFSSKGPVCVFSFCFSPHTSQRHAAHLFLAEEDVDELLRGGAGEAQLRFHQDKGKGKLFTLTRTFVHKWRGEEKKSRPTSVWKMEEPTSVNCLCL